MDFARQVKSQVDITQVIGDFVRLKKQGSDRWVGLCPFHSEKTPSFSVHQRLQIFKCFGCGKGGDVFNFLMEHQGLSFYEALTLLAEQRGIPLPKRRDDEAGDAQAALKAGLLRMHDSAQTFFAEQLRAPAAGAARDYVRRRGLDAAAVEEFGLGYAPAGSQLSARLRREGFTEEQLAASGLVSRSEERGDWYDFFRDRLMFPIADAMGRVIAFGARALRDDQQPKYLNSRDSPIYNKGAVLYNLHRAREAMRRENRVVLVEGYMDVIGVSGAGIAEVAAACGTALRPDHIRGPRRLVDTAIVNFDSDDAGRAAAEKSVATLLAEGFHVRVLELPDGADPDEFCRERGVEAYRERLDAAADFSSWLAERARSMFDLRTSEGRVSAFEFLRPSIQLMPDKIQRAALADDLAERMGVDRGLIREEFRRAAIGRSRGPLAAPPRHPLSGGERLLLELFLESEPARAEMLDETAALAAAEGLASREIFAALAAAHRDGGFEFGAVEGRLNERDREIVSAIVFDRDRPEVELDKGRRAFAALRQDAWSRRHRALRREITEAERAGDRARALELLKEKAVLERRLGLLAGRGEAV